jgi:hypothetical protein
MALRFASGRTLQGPGLQRRSIAYVRRSPKKPSKQPAPLRRSEPACSILARYFEDDGVDSANYVDYNGMYIPYVNTNTPLAERRQDIRGVYSMFVEYLFSRQLIKQTPIVYNCEYFCAYYFPAWHFVACGRKSRPSLVTLYGPGQEYNGEKPVPEPTVMRRSRNPMAYAVWRNYINRSFKVALFESIKNCVDDADGVYILRATKVVTDEQVLQAHMDKAVQKAIASKKKPMSWVEDSNNKVVWSDFNEKLKAKFMPPVTRSSRNDWVRSR